MAGFQSFGQRRLVDQAAAGAVDDAHALLGLGEVLGVRMPRVLSVIGTCSVMKSARGQQLVELDLGHARSPRPAPRRQERVIGEHLHPGPRAGRDDAADIARADDAERLAGDLDAHEFRLLPLAGLGGGVGGGIWRATANIIAMACSAVVIELPKGVFITMMPGARRLGMSTLSTPMPARPITLRLVAAAISFSVALVAERMARPSYSPMISSSLSLSLPMEGSKVDVDAAIAEDLDGGFRQLVGNENAWGP
jgi:hypothetical protein